MSANNGSWKTVTPVEPCRVCGRSDWCRRSIDGRQVWCGRTDVAPVGMRLVKRSNNGGTLFAFGNGAAESAEPAKAADWPALAERFKASLSDEKRDALAGELGVTPVAPAAVGIGWATREDLLALGASGTGWHVTDPSGWRDAYPGGAYSFPERDGAGRIVGFSFRLPDGRKGAPSKAKSGASRGLIVPETINDRADPVLFVEGASDVAACETLHLAAVGRPSNSGGADDLAKLLRGRAVLVIGERDAKVDGRWPGRDGAKAAATRLATAWKETVGWTLPPEGAKDIRAWLQERVSAGLDLADAQVCKAAGEKLLAQLQAAATQAEPEKKISQSESIARLALELYRFGRTDSDEPFAVAHNGPNIALLFRGTRDALRCALARDYRKRTGRTPSASALADAMTCLQGMALDAEAEPVYLRVAEYDGGIVIDLGDASGRAIIVKAGAWEVVHVSPVLFRRTALTGALPMPQRGGDLNLLRDLLNVSDDTWPVLVGWLVAAFMPGIPHSILLLGGLQGTGKSTAARYIIGLFDPSPAPLRSQPREPRSWAISAAGSWGVAVDNVSGISEWWSDALCKVVTGDGWIDRRLYTNDDVAVLAFRRVVMLTSIDTGALRGDLGDRVAILDLLPIEAPRRRTEAELDRLYQERRPLIVGALLDLLADVLTRLLDVKLPALPRMADFGRVLAALDAAAADRGDCGEGRALALYLTQADRIAGDVVEADPVAAAVVKVVDDVGAWEGTSADLLSRLTPTKPPKDWPKSARALAGRLKRLVFHRS